MYSTPLNVNKIPESIVKDFSTASKDISRQITRGSKNEFKFFIKGIEFNLSKNDADILDTKIKPNKENTVKVQLKGKHSTQHSKKIDKEIDIKIHHNLNNSIDNWTQFFEELLKTQEFELNEKEQQNIINMLKGYGQQRFGMKIIEACEKDNLYYPLRVYNNKNKKYKVYNAYTPDLVFAHGSPIDQPVQIGIDKDKNATLKTKFPFKTQMITSDIFGKFQHDYRSNKEKAKKEKRNNKKRTKNTSVTYRNKYEFYNLTINEKTLLKADKNNIWYEQADVSGYSLLLIEYFKNKENVIGSLQINNITDNQIKELIPDIQKVYPNNSQNKPNDKEIAKNLIKEIRLFAGFSILDYQAKLTKEILANKTANKKQKELLLKKLNKETKSVLDNLRHLRHPKNVDTFVEESKETLKKKIYTCLTSSKIITEYVRHGGNPYRFYLFDKESAKTCDQLIARLTERSKQNENGASAKTLKWINGNETPDVDQIRERYYQNGGNGWRFFFNRKKLKQHPEMLMNNLRKRAQNNPNGASAQTLEWVNICESQLLI